MPEELRALIVILVLAVPIFFYIGQRVASSVIAYREFTVWRNVWFAFTIVAFLSGSFLVQATMLLGVCVYARSSRAESVGLYFILLFAIPLANVSLSGVGIVNRLFVVNNARLLAIFLLLPILLSARGFDRRQRAAYVMADWFVVGFVLYRTALHFRDSEITNVMREATVNTLDILIPYFAFSRVVTSTADLRKVFVAFIVAVLPLSLIAGFELVKGWRLYAAIGHDLGRQLGYLRREGMLRASATAAGGISFGFMVMVAIGCLTGISAVIRGAGLRKIVFGIFAIGLVASLSRGPWVGTAVLLLVYLAIGPNAIAKFGKLAIIGPIVLMLLFVTPVWRLLVNLLPFVGTVETHNIDYRKQLFTNSMVVIERYPWFGSPDFRSEPEILALHQGGGIDIVNTYLEIALYSGLVGLSMFVGIFGTILIGLRRVLKFQASADANYNTYVRASIAILLAILVTIATVSSIDFIPYIYWSFAGLSVALIRIGYKERSLTVRAVQSRARVG
jgi:O-Antigen ligase